VSNYLDQPRTFNNALELVPFASVTFTDMDGQPAKVYNCLELRADPDTPGEWLYEYSAPLPNPMTSDAAARLPLIFLDKDVTYRMVMADPAGNVLHNIPRFETFPGPDLITPYTDSGESMPNAVLTAYRSNTTEVMDELTANSEGVFETPLVLGDGIAYRVALHDENGYLIYDVDPYPGNGVGIAGGGGCVCPNEAMAVFDANGVRQRWTNVDGVDWFNGDTGQYQVNFTAGTFTTAPVVNATAQWGGLEAPRCFAEVDEVTADYAIIRVFSENGTPTDRGVHVVAWEPENVASTG
jgi:hypothetical protein